MTENKNRAFKNLIGHSVPFQILRKMIFNNKLPQVTLLEGQRGIGKSILARKIAAVPFCDILTGCGQCDGCHKIENGSHLECLFLGVEDEKNLKNESIKAIQEFVDLKPSDQDYSINLKKIRASHSLQNLKIVIIEDFERLTISAMNRLLKTFEEPPSYLKFIITTPQIDKILPTILSRSVRLKVLPLSAEENREILKVFKNSSLLDLKYDLIWSLTEDYQLPVGYSIYLVSKFGNGIKEVLDGINEWFLGKDLSKALESAKIMAREQKIPLDIFMDLFEIKLNRFYKWKVTGTIDKNPNKMENLKKIYMRRENISIIKRMGIEKSIPINFQLAVESMIS